MTGQAATIGAGREPVRDAADEPVTVSTTRHGADLLRTSVRAGALPLELIIHRTPAALRMGVHVRDVQGASVTLDLRTLEPEAAAGRGGGEVEGPPTGTVEELLEGRPGDGLWGDFVRKVAMAWDLTAAEAVGVDVDGDGDGDGGGWDGDGSRGLLASREVWRDATRAAVARELALVAASHPEGLVAFVARFPEGWRVPALRWLRSDVTGRVRQLAEVEPGAFLLGLLLAVRHHHRADDYFASVEAGRRVNELIDEGLAGLAPAHADRRALRLLVRRSGPQVDPMLLPFVPFHFVPEDIPSEPRANARWHALMRTGLHRARDEAAAPDLRRGYFDFWSRYACTPVPDALQPAHLWDFVEATGRRIDRHTSHARLLRDEQAWMEGLWAMDDDGPSEAARRAAALDARSPPPFLPAWEGPAGRVEPLRTRRRLLAEGRTMRHCAGRYGAELLAGRLSLFHLESGGEHATLALEQDPGRGVRVHDFRGPRNQPPAPALERLLRVWLDAHEDGRPAASYEAFATDDPEDIPF